MSFPARPSRSRPALLTWLGAVCAALLLASGCSFVGDDSASDDSTPAAATSTSTPAAEEPTSDPVSPSVTETPTDEPTTAEPTTEAPSETPTETAAPTEEPTVTPTSTPTTSAPEADDGTGPPPSYDAAVARVDGAGTPQTMGRFETSDGTYCLLQSGFVRGACELLQGGARAPELCGDGPSQRVGRIELTKNRPRPLCNTDTIREPGAPSIEVGQVGKSSKTGIACLWRTDGVTCVDEARGTAFFLGAEAYQVYS
ncbi:MAG: hypothetical protein CMH83_02560 [Nocardioides sp.]|nr:hypothetical protein [Nocardioides sp.]